MADEAAPPAPAAAPEVAPEAPPPAPEPLQPPDRPDPEGDSPRDRRARATEIVRRGRKKAREPEPPEAAKPAEEPAAEAAPEEAPEAEAAAEEAKPEPDEEPEKPSAKDWKKLRREKQALAQQARQIERERQEIALARAEQERDEQLRRQDPYAWARKHGLSMRELAKKAVGEETKDPRDTEIAELKAQIADLTGFRQSFEERQQQSAMEQARASVRTTVTQEFASTSADEFPYLHAHAPEQVAEAVAVEMIEHFRRTHEELSPRDVMAAMERNLREYDQRLAAARNRGKPQAPQVEAPPAAPRGQTGDISSRQVAARASDAGPLTAAEKRRRALDAVRARTGRFG